MIKALQTEIGRLRVIAHVEGWSFLLILFVTMPMKYFMDMPMPNKIVGMAHGILFILYVLAVIVGAFSFKWDAKTTFLALLASIIPFGTFWIDAKYFKKLASLG
jgi:integral membrane protein